MRGTGSLKVCLTLVILTTLSLTTKQAYGQYGGGSGTAEDPYLIYTAEQMNTIGLHYEDSDKYFKLMTDIDLSAYTGTSFNIISYFSGTFDGNGHKISNFNYYDPGGDMIGIFGGFSGTVKNLGLISPDVDAATSDSQWDRGLSIGALIGWAGGGNISGCYIEGGSVSGNVEVGGLAGGFSNGTMTDCYSTCEVSGFCNVGGLVGLNDFTGTITRCNFSGSVSGENGRIGGLVGLNYGIISACHSAGSVTGVSNDYYEGTGGLVGVNSGDGIISHCYSTADVSERYLVGGLVGVSWGQISDCYATGNAHGVMWIGGLLGGNAGYVYRCYSTGNASGSSWIGGLVGGSEGGVTIGSFWDRQTSGNTSSVGGIGKTTSQMQTKSTFTSAGWDFTMPIWTIEDNDYPRLWWEENILYVPGHYPTIQAAIDAAVNGDTVVIAPGTYTGEGNRDIDFKGKAITVRSTDPNNPNIVAATIVDCQGTEEEPHRGFYFNKGEGLSSVLDGLTITNGYEKEGSGIFCYMSNPEIRNCIIQNNSVATMSGTGGGMLLRHSDSKIINCTISENIVTGSHGAKGGGISCEDGCPQIIDCNIIQNSLIANSLEGSGIYFDSSSPIISGSIITYNSGEGEGAGSVEAVNSNITLTDCYIKSNSGGIVAYEESNLTVENSVILNNSGIVSPIYVFGYSNLDARNCLIAWNSTTTNACPGILLGWESSFLVHNCTIVGNISLSGQASAGGICYNSYSSSGSVLNSIVWNNWGEEIAPWYPNPTVSISVNYSNIEGGYYGEGNIDVDPLFVDLNSDDFHLLPDSPCIDAGDPCSPWELEPWPNGARVNMGAYGNTPEATRSRNGLQFAGFSITERSRIDRTIFRYVLSLSLSNITEDDITDVYVELIDASGQVINVIDDEIFYPLIEADSTVDSSSFGDYFIIEVDRSELITPGRLTWQVDYTRTDSSQMQVMSAAVPIDVTGDISGNGEVDFEDLWRLAEKWLWTGQAGEIAEDIFADGIVDFKDFAEIAGSWRY